MILYITYIAPIEVILEFLELKYILLEVMFKMDFSITLENGQENPSGCAGLKPVTSEENS